MHTSHESVPISREFAHCVRDMLHQNGFSRALVCGHSVGTVYTAQILHHLPEIVSGAVLLDPVCFRVYIYMRAPDSCAVCRCLTPGLSTKSSFAVRAPRLRRQSRLWCRASCTRAPLSRETFTGMKTRSMRVSCRKRALCLRAWYVACCCVLMAVCIGG